MNDNLIKSRLSEIIKDITKGTITKQKKGILIDFLEDYYDEDDLDLIIPKFICMMLILHLIAHVKKTYPAKQVDFGRSVRK